MRHLNEICEKDPLAIDLLIDYVQGNVSLEKRKWIEKILKLSTLDREALEGIKFFLDEGGSLEDLRDFLSDSCLSSDDIIASANVKVIQIPQPKKHNVSIREKYQKYLRWCSIAATFLLFTLFIGNYYSANNGGFDYATENGLVLDSFSVNSITVLLTKSVVEEEELLQKI